MKRSSGLPPLGLRTVAGKVVNESYGAGKQQHTFTVSNVYLSEILKLVRIEEANLDVHVW